MSGNATARPTDCRFLKKDCKGMEDSFCDGNDLSRIVVFASCR
jgi:hypothetical protein